LTKFFFSKEEEKSAHFSLWVLACSQKCEGGLNVFTSYPVYSQIWRKFIMEDHHSGYRTKMKKKDTDLKMTKWEELSR
jgi:hypothetical protein